MNPCNTTTNPEKLQPIKTDTILINKTSYKLTKKKEVTRSSGTLIHYCQFPEKNFCHIQGFILNVFLHFKIFIYVFLDLSRENLKMFGVTIGFLETLNEKLCLTEWLSYRGRIVQKATN